MNLATDLAVKAVQAHPSVKCFVGLLSYSAPAVIEALKQTGRAGQIRIVGFDVDERSLSGIEEGQISATVMQDQFGLGYHAVRILANEARGIRAGLPLFQTHLLPCKRVTRENVAEIRRSLAKRGAKEGGS